MIKKIEIGMGILLFVLCIFIVITFIRQKKDGALPQDTVYDFFTLMTQGNFESAMDLYLTETNDKDLGVLNDNYDLYKNHWANLGITIEKENYNYNDKTATCDIVVHKYNIAEILSNVTLKLLNVNTVKDDGTQITEEELQVLKKQYIKEAYSKAKDNYSVVKNSYSLKLVYDEEYDTWLIVNDESIRDILFGNESDKETEDKAA